MPLLLLVHFVDKSRSWPRRLLFSQALGIYTYWLETLGVAEGRSGVGLGAEVGGGRKD